MIFTALPLGIISAGRVTASSDSGVTARAGSINHDLLQSSKTVTYNSNATELSNRQTYSAQALKTLSSQADRQILGEAICYVDYADGVPGDNAMRMADWIFTYDSYKSQGDNDTRNRIVIFFGDESDGGARNDTVTCAATVKAHPNTYIFVLGIMKSGRYDTNPNGNKAINSCNELFHATSSNYLYATGKVYDGRYQTVVYCTVCNCELSRETTVLHPVAYNVEQEKLYTLEQFRLVLDEAVSGERVIILECDGR